jgi:hypothetical protein
MHSHFGAYVPELWYEDGILMKRYEPSGEDPQVAEPAETQTTHRTNAVEMALSESITVNQLVIAAPPSDSLLSGYQATGQNWPGAKYAEHSASATNEAFGRLFADFRNGVKLINDEEVRAKAKAAAALRQKKPDASWAKKLADDVKDADD